MLWFLGTFITLWAVSLSVRGFLHRSRVAGARRGERGPRRVKWGAVWSGVAVLPVGIGACYAGEVLFAWMYGDSSGAPSVLTVGRAMALGVAAFGAVVAAGGWWGERERGERRCP